MAVGGNGWMAMGCKGRQGLAIGGDGLQWVFRGDKDRKECEGYKGLCAKLRQWNETVAKVATASSCSGSAFTLPASNAHFSLISCSFC